MLLSSLQTPSWEKQFPLLAQHSSGSHLFFSVTLHTTDIGGTITLCIARQVLFFFLLFSKLVFEVFWEIVLNAFTLPSLYTKIIPTNPPHQSRQTANGKKFFYIPCLNGRATVHLKIKNQAFYIIFSLFYHFLWRLSLSLFLSTSHEPRWGQIGLEGAEIELWKLRRPRTSHGKAKSCSVIWVRWVCVGNLGFDGFDIGLWFDGFDFGLWFDNLILKHEVLVSSRKWTSEMKAVAREEECLREVRST